MEIKELNYTSGKEEKDRFIKAYLAIWNHPEDHIFHTYTGQSFILEIVKSWIDHLNNQSEIKYFTAIVDNTIVGIIVLMG